jgi:iron complex outermembrane receptor protein
LDTNAFAPEQPPFLLVGNSNFQSETARVYELGYRGEPTAELSFSVTGYHYNYFHLRSENLESTSPLQLTFGNDMTGTETGLEMWGAYQPTASWRLSAGFSTLREDHTLSGTALPNSIPTEGDDAPSRWMLRSSYEFTGGEELDISARHVAALPNPATPAYTTGDVRFGWSLGPKFECSLLAQNIFGPAHIEFGTPATASEFGRGLYLKLTWRQ